MLVRWPTSFSFHFRSILIVTIPLPLAVLISFLFMKYMGISSNLMSLSGIAIAIGVLVDAGIVVTENAFRFLEKNKVDPKDRGRVWQTVLESTKLVGRPVFFSMAIIILAFIPVFALTGQEGSVSSAGVSQELPWRQRHNCRNLFGALHATARGSFTPNV